jgi:hypothetical protein
MHIKQIIEIDPLKDPRVILDLQKRELIPESQRCKNCGGTGNELLFMYRECRECGGSGIREEFTN